MSAFVVSREHISYLVQAATSRRLTHGSNSLSWIWNCDRKQGTYDRDEIKAGDYAKATAIGQMLWDENIKSVCHRYPDCVDDPENMPGVIGENYIYEFHYNTNISIDPIKVLKLCDSLDYQSCEHPEWEDSEAYAFIQSLRGHAWRSLPGYDKAEWEL